MQMYVNTTGMKYKCKCDSSEETNSYPNKNNTSLFYVPVRLEQYSEMIYTA